MEDRSPEIIRLVTTILEQSDAALSKLRDTAPSDFDKSTVAPELLVILHTADEFVAFFDPSLNAIEYHGVPRSMTETDDPPRLVLRSKDGFDFWPWYCEKSASLKWEAAHAVAAWHGGPEQILRLPDDTRTSAEIFVAELIRRLEGVRAYAHAIVNLTSERRVMVQEIRFRPEDSN